MRLTAHTPPTRSSVNIHVKVHMRLTAHTPPTRSSVPSGSTSSCPSAANTQPTEAAKGAEAFKNGVRPSCLELEQ